MNRSRGGLAPGAGLALTAAATTWVAMFSWRGFTQAPGRFLGPLFILAAVIAGTGALARWWRVPAPLVVGLQLLIAALVASAQLSGSPIPVGAAWERLATGLSDAFSSADKYAAPVPAQVPGVHPLLILGGLLCLLLVDLLACTLRRVPLAGLPLLAIYSIPVSLLGGGVAWWVFTLTAAGFLGLLFLQESEQVARWGRPLGEDPAAVDPSGFGVATGMVRTTAGTIGGVATALAIVVPLLVPTLSLHLFDLGQGPGGSSDIRIDNPMTDLRRDLSLGEDIALLRITTDDPSPSYLRISVLNRFSANEWSSGDRDVPTDQLADGELPALVGVDSTVPRVPYHYEVAVTPQFSSTWLPVEYPVTRADAPGDWRYDSATMDFIASEKGLSTAGLTYSMTSVRLQLSAVAMARATSSSGLVSKAFTELPPGIPSTVRNLANGVTRDAPSRFEKAVALQEWFRETGGFTYDTKVAPGNGTDDLVHFLVEGEDGRTGYCEQFASAMAVMARILGIPARVAVGFLQPTRVGPDTWEYSAHDLHAWPELFFPGSGWVRFEPTPAGRASNVPGYTTQVVPVINPGGQPGNPRPSDELPSRGVSASASPSKSSAGSTSGDVGSGLPWGPLAGTLGGGLVVALLLLLPRTLRLRRREHRLGAGVEAAWAELRATAIDLGVPWPEGRSPRETAGRLVEHFGAPVGPDTEERPGHGPDRAPEAVVALDRIVRALELLRYARLDPAADATRGAGLRAEAETCLAALRGGAARSNRRRADWWPRSVLTPVHRSSRRQSQQPVQARYGGVVDHVG